MYFCGNEKNKDLDIVLKNLSVGYGRIPVATGINAIVSTGQLVCLVGRNGAGKSTLLRTITGLQATLSGEIRVGDDKVGTMTAKELAKTVGIVLTERPMEQNMTIRELAELGRTPYSGFLGMLSQEDKDIADDALRQVGITNLADKHLAEISDGERQKAMIARTIAQQTPVILLDEPTAFLDFTSKVELLLLLQRLSHNEGKTILLTTHDISLAMKMADEIWLLQDGHIIPTPSNEKILDFIGPEAAKYI